LTTSRHTETPSPRASTTSARSWTPSSLSSTTSTHTETSPRNTRADVHGCHDDVSQRLDGVEPLAAVVQASLDPVSAPRDAPCLLRRAVGPLGAVVYGRHAGVEPFAAAPSVCPEGGSVSPDVVKAIRGDSSSSRTVYTRAEVECLISSDLVPWDRQMLYALQALAGASGSARSPVCDGVATTMKYMHLSPANRAAAIGLLDAAWTRPEFGETVEKQAKA
jgi:hypothetical protein